jgi:cobaltochelatase CobS
VRRKGIGPGWREFSETDAAFGRNRPRFKTNAVADVSSISTQRRFGLINGVKTGMYECTQGTSNKFYEVTYDARSQQFRIRYGKIGTPGTVMDADHGQAMEKIREKLAKGYKLVCSYPNGLAATPASGSSTPAVSPVANVAQNGDLSGFRRKVPALVGATIRIAEVDLPLGLGGDLVPLRDEIYVFPAIATDVCLDLLEGRNILLTGHMGTGKSSLFEQIAARLDQGVIRINCNGQMTVSTFVGHHGLRGGETLWVDGFLPEALKNGYWVILDELDCADPRILSIVNGILETNGRLFLKEKDGREVIRAHPSTRFLATANTVGSMEEFRSMYQGTNLLNEAFLDRFRIYRVDYLPEDEEMKVIQRRYPDAPVKWVKMFVQGASLIRQAFMKQEISKTMSIRGLCDWIEMSERKGDATTGLKLSFLSRVSFEDAEAISTIIKRVF